MEARALTRFIGSSPRKMGIVADLIRGKNVQDAQDILSFTNKAAAKVVKKTLLSAYDNLVRKHDTGRIDKHEVVVKRVMVNGGASLKRMLPAPQGRAFRIRKRSAHINITVEFTEIEKKEVTK